MGNPFVHVNVDDLEAATAKAKSLGATDLLDPVWNMFDLAPEGRGDFQPKLDYTSRPGK